MKTRPDASSALAAARGSQGLAKIRCKCTLWSNADFHLKGPADFWRARHVTVATAKALGRLPAAEWPRDPPKIATAQPGWT